MGGAASRFSRHCGSGRENGARVRWASQQARLAGQGSTGHGLGRRPGYPTLLRTAECGLCPLGEPASPFSAFGPFTP
jgi:hypothetical protein